MLSLVSVEDTICLEPATFRLSQERALQQEISNKFCDRVVAGVGLGVALYDVQRATDGIVVAGRGGQYIECNFRLVVFSPWEGEVLVGWISSCTSEGINVRMEFFDEIFIPRHMLFEGCHFVVQEQAWVWRQDEYELFFDTNEKIRFRVEACEYEKGGMRILGSCQVDGMGVISWW